jgi:hypothetical protein
MKRRVGCFHAAFRQRVDVERGLLDHDRLGLDAFELDTHTEQNAERGAKSRQAGGRFRQ